MLYVYKANKSTKGDKKELTYNLLGKSIHNFATIENRSKNQKKILKQGEEMKICSQSETCTQKCHHKKPHERRNDCAAACGINDEVAKCFTYDAFGEVKIPTGEKK